MDMRFAIVYLERGRSGRAVLVMRPPRFAAVTEQVTPDRASRLLIR